MTVEFPRAAAGAASIALLALAQLTAPVAAAQEQHNVTYRARVDGASRDAVIAFRFDDTATETAQPTMLPGRTFEAQAVLTDPALAAVQISIGWPYSANLHCEIEVDGELTAQANTFVAPRLFPVRDDPGFGTLLCGAPLDAVPAVPAPDTATAPQAPLPA